MLARIEAMARNASRRVARAMVINTAVYVGVAALLYLDHFAAPGVALALALLFTIFEMV
ncbi:MAG TPA: hypothetical protein VFA48_05595 [Gammaproteobacteria bacterium]|nr:hypothetical protein [Gammaproteobacteria bacterium]